jgi:N-acetylglucosamine kinase-like BadF-type ATPase
MSDLIRNLQEALEEMTKTGNEKAINILEKAIQQANKLTNQKQVPQ